jgi:hypothetical protein
MASIIVSTVWSQISGSTVTIVSPASLCSEISGITVAGNYTFLMTVTDNVGNVATSRTSFAVMSAGTPTITLSFHRTSGNIFRALASVPVPADVHINELFADGFTAGDCSGSAIASAQYTTNYVILPSGSTSVDWSPDSTTGTWASTSHNNVFNAIVNSGSVANGSIVNVGGTNFQIVIATCESN